MVTCVTRLCRALVFSFGMANGSVPCFTRVLRWLYALPVPLRLESGFSSAPCGPDEAGSLAGGFDVAGNESLIDLTPAAGRARYFLPLVYFLNIISLSSITLGCDD